MLDSNGRGTAKRVMIDEPRLGMAKYILQATILIGFIIQGVWYQPWLVTEIPSGSANFWGTSNPKELARNQAQRLSYCDGVSYGDIFCRLTSLNTSCDGPPPYPGCDGIFCEYNIGCASLPFSEINLKMPTEMFFMTIIKDYTQVIAACGDGEQQLSSESCNRTEGWTFQVINETLGSSGLCSCHRMQNIFPKGVETIDLTVSHTIKTANTNLREFRGTKSVNLPTTVYEHDEHAAFSRGRKVFTLGHGKRLQRSIGDILQILGMDSLDDHNAEGALGRPTIDPAMDGNLAYRITGAQVVLTFDYRSNDGVRPGNPSSGDLACHLTARLKGGWHSRGSEVHYSDAYGYPSGHDFPLYDSKTGEIVRQTFHDRYKRGIRFNFEFTGLVGETHVSAVVLWLTSLVVFLAVAETVVGFVVFNLLGFRSEVYSKTANERVIMIEKGARAACQAIQTFDTFEKVATIDDDGEKCVTHETLTSLVTKLPDFNREDAAGLAVAVVKTFGHNGKSLNFDEWANLTTEGSLFVKKWTGAGSEDADEARLEKLIAPASLSFFPFKAHEGMRKRHNTTSKVAPSPKTIFVASSAGPSSSIMHQGGTWNVSLDEGWTKMDNSISSRLSEAKASGLSSVSVKNVRGFDYDYDFTTMTQTNLQTGKKRAFASAD